MYDQSDYVPFEFEEEIVFRLAFNLLSLRHVLTKSESRISRVGERVFRHRHCSSIRVSVPLCWSQDFFIPSVQAIQAKTIIHYADSQKDRLYKSHIEIQSNWPSLWKWSELSYVVGCFKRTLCVEFVFVAPATPIAERLDGCFKKKHFSHMCYLFDVAIRMCLLYASRLAYQFWVYFSMRSYSRLLVRELILGNWPSIIVESWSRVNFYGNSIFANPIPQRNSWRIVFYKIRNIIHKASIR